MITPVLLVGGSGTRLWPLSRKSYPKQFAPVLGDESLFKATAKRLTGPLFSAPMVLTNNDFRFIVAEQLQSVGVDPGKIVIEPDPRNTGPAILAAALVVAQTAPQGLMLVAPSDHVLPDVDAFAATVEAGVEAARAGQIVTFGITPDRPETGYGYLELSTAPHPAQATRLRRFVEKPDSLQAQEMLAAGTYLWNAGIFLFRADTILAAFREHQPEMTRAVEAAVSGAQSDLGFLRLAAEPFAEAEDLSVDYAVMEKADNLSAVPFAGHWSDLGDWDAVWREMIPDDDGVILHGEALAIDCEQTLLRSETEDLALVGIGLHNLIAVATSDAVLVADRTRAQDVKLAVAALKKKGLRHAVQHPRDYRPWGWYETLASADRFQVKRIHVNPGAQLSLQSHHHRSEHWIVVTGTARVTLDGEVRLVSENQSIYVPLGAVHRMENPGKVPMVLIEVQTGTYLGEDDIIRYEDVYARP